MEPELNEVEAARQLLETGHLSVFDRKVFCGRIRLSVLVRAAEVALTEVPFLPSRFRPEDDFDGFLVERQGGSYLLHEKREVGVMRFGPLRTKRCVGLVDAIRTYLGPAQSVDGIHLESDV